MCKFKNTKTFMDSVHGYISVPNCFVSNIIDTDYFQRLRNVDQTGMRIVYPCAKHDRFSHSIGVFHLGQKAVESMIDSIYEKKYFDQNDNKIDINIELERNRILFLIACLLHDIGHTPFSHSLENQVLNNSYIKEENDNKSIANKLKDLIVEYEQNRNYENSNPDQLLNSILNSAPHEQMGSLLVFSEIFKQKIKNIFKELNIMKYTDVLDHTIKFDECENEELANNLINDDLCFIARMIMGIKYNDYKKERQIRNCFIELLNGKNFDVDKLDYIIRDTFMSGVCNIDVDVERLLKALCVNVSTKHKNKDNLNDKALKDVTILKIKNNNSDDKLNINGEFKGIIKIKDKTEVTINKGSKFSLIKGKFSLPGGEIGEFDNKTLIHADSIQLYPETHNGEKVIFIKGNDTGSTPLYEIENATTLKTFTFIAEDDVELSLHNECDMTIKGQFESVTAISVFECRKIDGNICDIEILDDTFKKDITTNKEISSTSYNSYHLGFKKQAINVIANVLRARNFLYLWIYSHHKVVYYANFLIPIITNSLFNNENEDINTNFPHWTLCYDNIKYLDDYYIWTLIRHALYSNDQKYSQLSEEIKTLMEEALNRSYKRSLYKSLVEFDLFFESFTEDQMMDLIDKINKKIDVNKPNIKNNKDKFEIGYFKDETLEEINELIINNISDENNKVELSNLIFVEVNYKMKKLQPSSVYIDMGNQNYVPISKMTVLEIDEDSDNKKRKKNYFYLYYSTNIDVLSLEQITLIKKVIYNYFKQILND